MIKVDRCQKCGILWIRAVEPFSLDELMDGARQSIEDADVERTFGQPVLLDFQSVTLLRYTAEDFKRAVRRRLEYTKEHKEVPYALVARSDADYGMLRMYTTYVEIAGLRSLENSFVTTDRAEAVRWLMSRSRCSVNSACMFSEL
jgi:hypothetical protein